MKCPKCDAPIFENDRYCGECGSDVSAVTMPKTNDTQVEQSIHPEPATQKSSRTVSASNTYFKSVLSFLKQAVIRPGTLVSDSRIYSPSVTSGTVGILAVIVSLLFFIMSRSLAGPYGEIPLSMLMRVFFVLAVMIAVFYGVTMLMNVLLLKTKVSWQQIMHDFSITTSIVLGFFIVAIAFTAITLVEIGVFFWIVGLLLFMTAPIYIFLKYARDENVKFDSFYSLVIYFLITAFVYYVVIRIAIAQSMSYVEDLFMF